MAGVEKRMVLLSIFEDPAQDILNGTKHWEYRRRPPKIRPPFVVLLLVRGAVVGSCLVTEILTDTPEQVVRKTIHETPHAPQPILEYFGDLPRATALRVEAPAASGPPVPIRASAPVQNFRYVAPPPSEFGELWSAFAPRLSELPRPKRWF